MELRSRNQQNRAGNFGQGTNQHILRLIRMQAAQGQDHGLLPAEPVRSFQLRHNIRCGARG